MRLPWLPLQKKTAVADSVTEPETSGAGLREEPLPADVPALVQLISEQTMQNVLPILAMRPATVLSVMSADTAAFRKAFENTQAAVRLAARKCGFSAPQNWGEPVILHNEPASPPMVGDTRAAVARLLEKHPGAWVNYTGGTKNMSIGAWEAAVEAGAGVVYCDTPNNLLFKPGGPGPLLKSSLRRVAGKLNTEIILAASGLIRDRDWHTTGSLDWLEPLGECSFRLAGRFGEEFRSYLDRLQRHGNPSGSVKKDDLNRALTKPLPAPPKPEFAEYLDTAVSAGLLQKINDNWFFNLEGGQLSTKRQLELLEERCKQITGVAFEACVQSFLRCGSRFSHWIANIQPGGLRPGNEDTTSGFGETDFVAYSSEKLSLTLISCKTSPPKLEHLESILTRKERLGGRFTQAILCLEFPAGPNREDDLRRRCKALGIECLIGPEIPKKLGVPSQT